MVTFNSGDGLASYDGERSQEALQSMCRIFCRGNNRFGVEDVAHLNKHHEKRNVMTPWRYDAGDQAKRDHVCRFCDATFRVHPLDVSLGPPKDVLRCQSRVPTRYPATLLTANQRGEFVVEEVTQQEAVHHSNEATFTCNSFNADGCVRLFCEGEFIN